MLAHVHVYIYMYVTMEKPPFLTPTVHNFPNFPSTHIQNTYNIYIHVHIGTYVVHIYMYIHVSNGWLDHVEHNLWLPGMMSIPYP